MSELRTLLRPASAAAAAGAAERPEAAHPDPGLTGDVPSGAVATAGPAPLQPPADGPAPCLHLDRISINDRHEAHETLLRLLSTRRVHLDALSIETRGVWGDSPADSERLSVLGLPERLHGLGLAAPQQSLPTTLFVFIHGTLGAPLPRAHSPGSEGSAGKASSDPAAATTPCGEDVADGYSNVVGGSGVGSSGSGDGGEDCKEQTVAWHFAEALSTTLSLWPPMNRVWFSQKPVVAGWESGSSGALSGLDSEAFGTPRQCAELFRVMFGALAEPSDGSGCEVTTCFLDIGPCGLPRLAALASELRRLMPDATLAAGLDELLARGSVSGDGSRDDGSGCSGRAGSTGGGGGDKPSCPDTGGSAKAAGARAGSTEVRGRSEVYLLVGCKRSTPVRRRGIAALVIS